MSGTVLKGIAGKIGPMADAVSTAKDLHDAHNGTIGVGRLGYKLSARALGFAVAGEIGGPGGAAVGLIMGLCADGAEWSYDNVISPGYDRTLYEVGRFDAAMNSWTPR